MDRLRLFVAVDMDREGIEKIKTFQKELMKELKEVRWTRENTWHITLKFIGEVREDKLEAIKKAITITESVSPIGLELNKMSAFPSIKAPRVIFIDIKENPFLNTLAEKVEDALFLLGFKKEGREFKAHITLGRVKETKKFITANPDFAELFKKSISHTFTVNEFHLYKSDLKKEGPVYTKLFTVPLIGAD